ncbi:LD-carboxypeptidase [Talaromyces proteolyticus]|uniref:LD-carboxypeptidase n=1 Tax=Talaromyces proteolyticus TaxID=1131652 RepID=A0AAD4PVS9_9EURO|nr:LD-carboxypeptidase [Talaromyces proteolyticus]KAH8693847.1 LD-carboxypeptidase [Talaromyces proteolyticus]
MALIPRSLKKGDTIAFVSPSFRLNDILPEPVERGKAYIESLGFHVKIFFNSLPPESTSIAESIRVRVEELLAAFKDPEVSAIITTIGGAHANELLPFLDYDVIKSNPKIFLGYSDITFLHYAIQSQTGLRTFYGPSILSDFADLPSPISLTVDHFLHVLTGSGGGPVGPIPRSTQFADDLPDFLIAEPDSKKPRALNTSPTWRWLGKGRASGRLYGGTIVCVTRLLAGPYAPSWKDKIVFLESAMGDDVTIPYSVDEYRNNLVDLALAGVFNDINGLVIGRGYKYTAEMQEELANVILEVFDVIVPKVRGGGSSSDHIPILFNVDVGHTSPLVTLPFDALARLDSEADEFTILEPGVQDP